MAINLSRFPVFSLGRNAVRMQRSAVWNFSRTFDTCDLSQQRGYKQKNYWQSRHTSWSQAGARSRPNYVPRRGQKTLSSRVMSNTPSLKQMEHFLTSNKMAFEHGHTSIIATCPVCAKKKAKEMKGVKDAKGDLTLYVNKTTGSHFCKQCGTSGSWKQLKVIRFIIPKILWAIMRISTRFYSLLIASVELGVCVCVFLCCCCCCCCCCFV